MNNLPQVECLASDHDVCQESTVMLHLRIQHIRHQPDTEEILPQLSDGKKVFLLNYPPVGQQRHGSAG